MLRIGLVGLGIMGRGLAKNIMEAGFPITVFDMKAEAVEAQIERGANAASSVADLVAGSDVVMTCLPSIASIREVYFGTGGIAETVGARHTVVDNSTATPALAREIAAALAPRGATFLDAPMLKTPQAAWDGTLQLPVGGDAVVVERVRPVLEAISEKIIPAGDHGSGQTIKLINNAMTLGNLAIVCEAFTVARKMGVDLQALFDATNVTMASSNQLRNTAPRLIKNDHSLSFGTDVALKDITAFTELALSAGAMVPTVESARDLLRLTSAAGYGQENCSRVGSFLASVAKTGFGNDDGSDA